MKINKIPRIKNHRIFRDFSWPAALQPFGRFNGIYGWNASGKSTLSNIFRAIEKESPIADGEVTIEIDNTHVQASGFAPASGLPRVKVFNRAFVDENVFASGSPITPIFFLGKESKEKQEEVERLRKSLDDPGGLNEAQRKAADTARKAERDLDAFCRSQGDRIREQLRSAGSNPFNNYDKAKYKKAAERLLVDGLEAAKAKQLIDSRKDELKVKKDAKQKSKLREQDIAVPDLAAERVKVDALLAHRIVSSTLAELEADSRLESWVKLGLSLHGIPGTAEHPSSSQCKFCKQPLPQDRVTALEGHFNDQYERLVHDLEAASRRLEQLRASLDFSGLPGKSAVADHLAEGYAAEVAALETHSRDARTYVAALTNAIDEKKKSPLKAISIEKFLTGIAEPNKDVLEKAMGHIVASIKSHNTACDDFDAMVAAARVALEEAFVAESVEEYEVKKSSETLAKREEETSVAQIAAANAKIVELEKDIVEHHRAADELNEELKRYLGRDELRFRPEGAGYAITRGGYVAKDLSEGEKTAIAFLYFLKSLQDKGFDVEKDIVVIDDPVSSLDANALFSAFGYMQQRTKTAGQLFILTHNFQFFRQVKNWFFHLNNRHTGTKKDPTKREARLFMLESSQSAAGRNSTIQQLDPLLAEYESEYHYLFKRVYDGSCAAAGTPLDAYYSLPNIARRLMEAFLSFRYPNQSGLREQLDKLNCDAATRARVIRFVHTYSHESATADEHDPTMLAETPAVLRDILQLIRDEDGRHHDEMMALVGAIQIAPAAAVAPATNSPT